MGLLAKQSGAKNLMKRTTHLHGDSDVTLAISPYKIITFREKKMHKAVIFLSILKPLSSQDNRMNKTEKWWKWEQNEEKVKR